MDSLGNGTGLRDAGLRLKKLVRSALVYQIFHEEKFRVALKTITLWTMISGMNGFGIDESPFSPELHQLVIICPSYYFARIFAMKNILMVLLVVFAIFTFVNSSEIKDASNERFKVEYVEPPIAPDLSVLPAFYLQKESAIQKEQAAVKAGIQGAKLDLLRRRFLRYAYFPIRVTDRVTGIVYEVQGDRRTIIAKKPDGTVLWKADPYKEGKVPRYRVDYPFITYFGKVPDSARAKEKVLGLGYNSSFHGYLSLEDGAFEESGAN